jgi:membrane protease YdiL (CAAX protease family)
MALVSLGAGVGEEGFWRGVLQTEYEMSMGRMGGWLVVSTLFGVAHAFNPDVKSMDEAVYASGIGTVGGLYLGWVFQRSGYMLSKSVAAHFWFNMVTGTMAFLIDPESNPLRVGVSFKF